MKIANLWKEYKQSPANWITSIRILLAPFLWLQRRITPVFLSLLTICGLTDLIDGPIARATGKTSLLGSQLDTVGDVLVYGAVVKSIFFQQEILLPMTIWLLITLMMQIIASQIANKRFGKSFFVHTLSGKAFGTLLFLLPFAMYIGIGIIWSILICLVATWAGIEALVIQSRSREPSPDLLSVFKLR